MDTGTPDRASNKKFTLCREVIKFDHHIPTVTYGDYQWVEELASSTCEMVVRFYDTFKDELKINTEAATYLYCGMVTDSGRFRFRDVSGDTMRYAGILLDQGVNTDVLFAQLYMKDLTDMRLQSYVYRKLKITENGVAYIYVDKKMQKKFGLTNEQASSVVSHLESIRGSLIWVALIDNPDGTIRVRLRSRFVTISEIGEKYRGGGHACAAGATLHSKREIALLLSDLDARLADYKANNEGWL
jgi:phosphoesterase RecJ-like protein